MKNKKYKTSSKQYKSQLKDNLSFYEETEFSKEFIDLLDPYFGRINHIGVYDDFEKIKKF